MANIAYIQSIGGASGDMLLGALVDSGVPLDAITSQLQKLNLSGYQVTAAPGVRCEVRGLQLTVTLADRQRFTPQQLLAAVANSPLSPYIKQRSEKVLRALWQAESRVHGEPEASLELEELGTLDTLVDVVGFAAALDYLNVQDVYSAPLVVGASTPPRWPGGYSNPAPATLELVAAARAPLAPDQPWHRDAGELTTPTGAAIITTLAQFSRPPMSVSAIGVGLGFKDPAEFPNVVRVWLGETSEPAAGAPPTTVTLLETNLDDATGEILGYVQERLFQLGALDVWHTSIQMKKNRPGTLLSVLVPNALESAAVQLILQETPTLGIRTRQAERYVAQRENFPLTTELGNVSVKLKYFDGKPVSVSPEYEDCRRIALEAGLPFQEVYQRTLEDARRRFLS